MSSTPSRLKPLLAIAVASVIAPGVTAFGIVTGMIPGVSRQAAAAVPGSQATRTQMTERATPRPLWTTTAATCSRCGTVTVVYYIEQPGEGLAPAGAGKQAARMSRWDVVVAMDDGSSRTFSSAAEPSFRPGDRIIVVSRTIMV